MGVGFNSGAARDYRAIVEAGAARLEAEGGERIAVMLCVMPTAGASVVVTSMEPAASTVAPEPLVIGRRLLVSVAPGDGLLRLEVDGASAAAAWRGAEAGRFTRCAPPQLPESAPPQ